MASIPNCGLLNSRPGCFAPARAVEDSDHARFFAEYLVEHLLAVRARDFALPLRVEKCLQSILKKIVYLPNEWLVLLYEREGNVVLELAADHLISNQL